MLWLGLILLAVGALVALTIHHTAGIVVAVIGLVLVIVALVFVADAESAMALLQR